MKTYFYEVGFDLSVTPNDTFSITLSTAGKADITVTSADITTTATKAKVFHNFQINSITSPSLNGSSSCPDWGTSSFASALQTTLRAKATSASWVNPANILVTLATTGFYTVAYSTANFGMDFTGGVSQYFLGFAAASYSGQKTYTGTVYPYYLLVPTLDCISLVSDRYEPNNSSSLAMPDSGVEPFGITRSVNPIYYDWTQQFEPRSKIFYNEIVLPNIFPFETLITHCRTIWPFILYTDTKSLVCYLRPESANFKPIRTHPDFDDYWHIPFKTLLIGVKT
jgi:hypothetical protein